MNKPQIQRQNYEIQPFFTTWLHPKKTAQYLIDHKKWTYALIFVLLGGMATGITGLEDTDYYPAYPTWLLLVGCIIGGPFLGFISVTISTFFSWVVGKIFKGKGTFEDVFKVTSLTSIPTIAIAPILLVWMANSPLTYFDTGDLKSSYFTVIVGVVSWLITILIGIWAFVINVAGIAVAHRFSNWKAFFTIIIPGIIFIVIIIVFMLLLALTLGIF
ncbi:Yip1 family protein [Rummeliibacillus sp. JY-2-4R]